MDNAAMKNWTDQQLKEVKQHYQAEFRACFKHMPKEEKVYRERLQLVEAEIERRKD